LVVRFCGPRLDEQEKEFEQVKALASKGKP